MRDSEPAVRCAQCRWTIAPDRVETVTLATGDVVHLHRGGCPPESRR